MSAMVTLDLELAVTLVVSMTALAALLFIALVVAMLVVIQRDPASHMDADWPPRQRR